MQWERTQPFTYFVRIKSIVPYVAAMTLFATNKTVADRGIVITMFDTGISLDLYSGIDSNRSIVIQPIPSQTEDAIIQITYDGGSSTSGMKLYYNNVLLTTYTLNISSLTGSIINTANSFVIGVNPFRGRHLNGLLYNTSIVNYVKSVAEMSADFTAKKQSIGTGAWLLAPVEPIYDGTTGKQIKTLDTASINAPLPNPNAFVNAQGYKMNLLGYPNPLVIGTNLIAI